MPSMSLRPTLPGSVCSELVTSLIVASGTVKTVESCLVKNVSPVSWMTSFPLIFSGNPVLPWMYSTSGNTSCAQTPTGSATMAAVANTAVTSLICSLRPHVACIGEECRTSPTPSRLQTYIRAGQARVKYQRTCHNETHNRCHRDHLRRLLEGRYPRRPHRAGRRLPQGEEARLQAADRLRGARRESLERPDREALRQGRTAWQAGARGGEFPATPDRGLPLGSADTRGHRGRRGRGPGAAGPRG